MQCWCLHQADRLFRIIPETQGEARLGDRSGQDSAALKGDSARSFAFGYRLLDTD
jgi:hypothetical protein